MNKIITILTSLVFICIFGTTISKAQCLLACNDYINISLPDYQCAYTFDADDISNIFLEGGTSNCPNADLELRLYENNEDLTNNNPLPNNTIDANFIDVELTYVVEDLNSSSFCWGTILVEDKIPPVAICDQLLSVQMGNTGFVTVYAQDLDDGSYDSCSDELTMEIRRTDQINCLGDDVSAFGNTVDFHCCDVGDTLFLELKVTDVSGNFSTCFTETIIINNLAPVLLAPADMSANCSTDLNAIDIDGLNQNEEGLPLFRVLVDKEPFNFYGTEDDTEYLGYYSNASSNCASDIVYVRDVSDNLNECNIGEVNRVFSINNGVTATQIISLSGISNFDINDIQFPEDYSTCSTDDLSNTAPVFQNDACSLVAVNYEDVYYEDNGIVNKIIRTWTVIDWCFYNEETATGVWTGTQVIDIDSTLCGDCTLACYDLVNLSLSPFGCSLHLENNFHNLLLEDWQCPIDDLSLSVYSDFIGFQTGNPLLSNIIDEQYSGDTLFYSITDLSTNDVCWGQFMVEDNNVPIPICLNDLVISFPENANDVELWATDLDSGSYDSCGEIVSFDIRRVNAIDCEGNSNTDFAPSLLLYCCDAGTTIQVEMQVTDSDGNIETCFTQVQVTGESLTNNFVPTDVTIDCDEDLSTVALPTLNLNQNGVPVYWLLADNTPTGSYGAEDDLLLAGHYADPITNCSGSLGTVEAVYVWDNIDNISICGTGLVVRNYNLTITGANPVTLAQNITIESGFIEPNITWPADITICGQTDPPLIEPIIDETPCTSTAYSYEDTVLTENGVETKIIRTWTLIDWCTAVIWTENQIINLEETACACTDGDCVFPGDTNSDGVADQFDLFHIGMASDVQGEVRPDATNAWEGQSCPNWTDTFAGDINYKHADCDGNGIVNAADVTPILENWGRTHNFNSTEDQATALEVKNDLHLYVEQDTFLAGSVVSLPILFKNTETDIVDVYGIAFSVHYEQDKVIANSASMDFSDSWLGTEDADMITIQKDFWDKGRIDLAMVRTDKMNINGQGKLASIDIIIEDVIFLNIGSDELIDLNFTIDNIRLINLDGEEIPINGSTTTSKIQQNPTAIQAIETSNISVYPNPASTELFIDLDIHETAQIQIHDLNGREILSPKRIVSREKVDVSSLASGLYILRVSVGEETYSSKLLIE